MLVILDHCRSNLDSFSVRLYTKLICFISFFALNSCCLNFCRDAIDAFDTFVYFAVFQPLILIFLYYESFKASKRHCDIFIFCIILSPFGLIIPYFAKSTLQNVLFLRFFAQIVAVLSQKSVQN